MRFNQNPELVQAGMTFKSILFSTLILALLFNAAPGFAWLVPEFDQVWQKSNISAPPSEKNLAEKESEASDTKSAEMAAAEAEAAWEASRLRWKMQGEAALESSRLKEKEAGQSAKVSFTENMDDVLGMVGDSLEDDPVSGSTGAVFILGMSLVPAIATDILSTPSKSMEMDQSQSLAAHPSAWARPDSMMAKFHHQQQAAGSPDPAMVFAAR
jgi:hypothetical protein